ncbi:MAG TPA: Rrf2 family transcriptional regulator [Rhodothermales bacterium]|nr:Rrf2 family transcriptional regulator [Rhodothermales bacterium]
MFSKTCEYAIKIMICVATAPGDGVRMGLDEIAEAVQSPKAFTAKILQQLARAGLLDSARGRNGGFMMPSITPIYLADIVAAVDGSGIMKDCVLGFNECSDEHPCPVHHKMRIVRDHLAVTLKSTSLHELKEVMERRDAYLTGA